MPASALPRHQLIQGLVTQQPKQAVEVTIGLWELLRPELLPIIGEEGFSAIYARSVYLCRSSHGWLPDVESQGEVRFIPLKISLQWQSPDQAMVGSRLLLTTFTDILATLIGDSLTDHLLRLAWGSVATSDHKESGHA